MTTTVRPERTMDDEAFISHLELRHAQSLGIMRWSIEPDRTVRRMSSRATWAAYHKLLHIASRALGDHEHEGDGIE